MDLLKAFAGGRDGLIEAVTAVAAEKLGPVLLDVRAQLLGAVTGEPTGFWVENFIREMRVIGYDVDSDFAVAVWGRFIKSLADSPCRIA
jgi:hypothetical protein